MKTDLSKNIYRLYSCQEHLEQLLYPKKHKSILAKQRRLNAHFEDKRRINSLSQHTNPQGQTFIFGRYGGRKNETMVTIGEVLANKWIILQNED